jgi:hypothetical protein
MRLVAVRCGLTFRSFDTDTQQYWAALRIIFTPTFLITPNCTAPCAYAKINTSNL